MTEHVLDDWIGNALRGGHRAYAVGGPGVLRNDPAVAVFGAVEPGSDLRVLDGLPTDDVVLATLAPVTVPDVPAMLELVALTHPGPFATRTIELGGYLGVREEGRLVAMAGRRVAPTGWTEISAVCTHPGFRGRGYGGRLGNPAQGLYESLGFAVRQRFVMTRLARTA